MGWGRRWAATQLLCCMDDRDSDLIALFFLMAVVLGWSVDRISFVTCECPFFQSIRLGRRMSFLSRRRVGGPVREASDGSSSVVSCWLFRVCFPLCYHLWFSKVSVEAPVGLQVSYAKKFLTKAPWCIGMLGNHQRV